MKAYFNPDINELREVPESERNKLLGQFTETQPDRAPDLLLVDQLLHMISFARESRPAQALC